jgi:ferrous iron transport protein A
VDLSECAAGRPARIVSVGLDAGVGLRMYELGLRAGALVRVTHDCGPQGRVVAVGAERFALDRRTCRAILVEAP